MAHEVPSEADDNDHAEDQELEIDEGEEGGEEEPMSETGSYMTTWTLSDQHVFANGRRYSSWILEG
jgi:hypothetical protein